MQIMRELVSELQSDSFSCIYHLTLYSSCWLLSFQNYFKISVSFFCLICQDSLRWLLYFVFCFTCAEINIGKLLVVSFYFCRINNFHWQKVFIKWTVYRALIVIQSFEDPKILVIYWKTSLCHPANLTYTNLLKKLCKT